MSASQDSIAFLSGTVLGSTEEEMPKSQKIMDILGKQSMQFSISIIKLSSAIKSYQ
jgi:hypothetical protein